mgnify:CR=1 FL=1
MDSKALNFTALTLVIIGAINWGLIGFFNFNLVGMLTGGSTSLIARVIYALVGIAGIYMLTMYSRLEDSNMTIQTK